MMVLGLETSSSVCSAGLADDRGPRGNRSIRSGNIHSEKLLSLIQALLEENNVRLRDIDAIAVSSGPGSFTGLRIGFSAAKGLCSSAGKRLAIVSTFHSLASSAVRVAVGDNILVALDAKKGDFYTGRFQKKNRSLEETEPVSLVGREALQEKAERTPGVAIVTDAPLLVREFLPGTLPVYEAAAHYNGEVIAMIGLEKAHHGLFTDVTAAEPLYLKDFIVKRKPSSS